MKFIKGDWSKKLIIVLIVLLLFNTLCPSMSYAVDLGGILLQPIYWLLLGIYIPLDISIGNAIRMQELSWGDISDKSDTVMNTSSKDWVEKGNGVGGVLAAVETALNKLFIGPDTIFRGEIKSFNANIFRYADGGDRDILTNVTKAVARFYVMLRDIAAVVMLGGLIFTGIRILLSANVPTKKTQYLMMLQDWLIGMGLLIFSHIIMILIFTMTDALVNALSISMGGGIKWQIIKQMGGSFDSNTQIIALVLYHWINILLIIFAIAYFKRFFWTCILVVFAPIMCVMYAFGQQTKQIYGNWLKEFVTNAFVQPFHLIVYTVLITFPMEIANGSTWTWSWNNGTEMTYCLMAMTMIRPAEKYLRRMFGMDKGIANMASYDSGKKTITDIGKAAVAVAKTAIAIKTGGASAMLGKGLGGAAANLATKNAGNVMGGLTDAGKSLNEAGDALGKLGDGANGANGANGLGKGDSTPEWISDDWQKDSQGRYLNPYNDEWFTEDELNAGRSLPGYMDQDDFDQSDVKSLTDGMKDGLKDGTNDDNKDEDNKEKNATEIADYIANQELQTGIGLSDKDFLANDAIQAVLQEEFGEEKLKDFNDIMGINSGKELPEDPKEFMKSLRENSEAKDQNMTDDEVAKAVGSDSVAGLLKDAGYDQDKINEYLGTEGGANGNSMNVNDLTINANSVNMEGDGIKTIGDGSFEGDANIEGDANAEGDANSEQDKGKKDDGISLEGAENLDISAWDVFEARGGLEDIGTLFADITDGFHNISSGMYIDGDAPTNEWNENSKWVRGNIEESRKKRKENMDREKENWANNKGNIKTMSDMYYKDELQKAQVKYGKTKPQSYIEAEAREKSDTKAKAALKDMSAYVEFGVKDVDLAYKLYQNANNGAFSPEQSIKNYAGYEKFKNDSGNVASINNSGLYQSNNYTTVEAAIPNAKQYYDAGYTNVNEMGWVNYMAERLGKSPEFAMQVDETLKKKGKGGKLTYSGKDADMKKVIDQINSHYGG